MDLARDCSRFVSTYFDIISASSPHIYHSALPVSPKTSIIWKLYASHAQPFIRVAYGRPDSWDSYTTATTYPFKIKLAAWSPCNRLIAVSEPYPFEAVHILDSVTLQKLQSFQHPDYSYSKNLIFSPDSRILTSCGYNTGEAFVVSWDLQTGCIVGKIGWKPAPNNFYTTHSTNGKIVAVLHEHTHQDFSISICDITSSKRTHNIDVPNGCLPCGIWTHSESLRFAVIDRRDAQTTGGKSVTIWEVGFAPGATATRVETLLTPEPVKSPLSFPQSFTHPQSLSTPRLPVVSLGDNIAVVSDAQTSQLLLYLRGVDRVEMTTCSSGGPFFACSIPGSGIYLWKDSPTGYVLHGKLPSPPLSSLPVLCPTPLLSPDGKSIIIISRSMVRLWSTKSFPNTPSDAFVEPHEFSFEFLRNSSLAVFSRNGGNRVTLLDFRSGVPQLIINAGMKVRGLGVTKDTVVAISDAGATTWKPPRESLLPGATMNVVDSTQTIKFCFQHEKEKDLEVHAASLSPDSRHIIIHGRSWGFCVYSATDGKYVHRSDSLGSRLWFTPNNRNVGLLVHEDIGYLYEVGTQGALAGEQVFDPRQGKHGCPCTSSDYEVLDDGWILGSRSERLLMLPPLWRSPMWQRVWNGQFLALLHGELPGPVILEFLVPPEIPS